MKILILFVLTSCLLFSKVESQRDSNDNNEEMFPDGMENVPNDEMTDNLGSMISATAIMKPSSPLVPTVAMHHSRSQCCGRKPYDHVRNICCKDVLFNRPANAACCYNKGIKPRAYNTLKQLCCQGNMVYRPTEGRCCGKVAYDSRYYICCRGKVIYIPKDKRCQPRCCGYKVYSYQKQRCCGGVVVPKYPDSYCCGKKSINYKYYTCCRGNQQKRPANARCCSRIAYNYLTQTCCYGVVYKRPNNASVYLEHSNSTRTVDSD